MAMTETQNLPHFPPPPYLGDPYRRLPQPVQLPPLAVPRDPVRPDFPPFFSPSQRSLPSIHSLPTTTTTTTTSSSSSSSAPAQSRLEQHRSQTRSAAPVDKLLSSHPYTPPRSDPPYSPPLHYGRNASPRLQAEARHPRPRPVTTRYPEEPRPIHQEPPYVSQGNPPPPPPQRQQTYQPLPSPNYTSSYPPSNASFRGSIDSHRGSAASSYGTSASYAEPAAPPPAQRPPPPPPPPPAAAPAPSSVGPSIVPSVPFRGPQQDKTQYEYKLIVRQQPVAARACGFGERDRRVIDPPPIIQLTVTDPKTGQSDPDELRYSLNVVHCTLWNADGTNEETALIQPDRRTTRRLMGQLVASPSVAKDEHDKEGCFFCFPDLSCRTHGKYRLRFVLMRIDPMNLHVGGLMPILTEVLSDVFTVYTAKDFPGMRPSSALTRALKLQGCNIQVKKGNEKALARRRASHISDEDDQGDNESHSGRKRRRE
ncbi:velvet factor-domain-containing protein [Macrophomina phaseolina]|uniref:Velvet factor-domain-containing protein n=1 Tax=Macrophomina phaseolina TaxID=35725 RepID=A0ABQ8GMY6_9PEZI|nr:velvet factor-domain-containing protein [Macrophomina phaseolina]